MTISEAAKKFNISERSVRNYCQHGRIPGVVFNGKSWDIPSDAAKPERSNGKENNANDEVISCGYGLIDFINASPVSFFAIDNVKKMLLSSGYVELFENKAWDIKRGQKIFFTRNDSSIIALNLGRNIDNENVNFHIISSHSDSPCFKIKPESESKTDTFNKLNVEPYGGMIMPTWLDRPLGVAGRVIVKTEDGLEVKLVNLDENTAMIPNLCIHFNRGINNGYQYDPSVDMQAFISMNKENDTLKKLLCKKLNFEVDSIVNYDLYLYNRDNGYLWGIGKEFVSSSRLDDLECVYTSLVAFKESENNKSINVLYVADNEEVGSGSRQGADSDFLDSILGSVCQKLGAEYNVAIANSFMISADNAHSVHPNKPGISDANNRPYMNKGIAIKYNASQSYTSDAVSGAVFQKLCENSDTPYQFFTNRSDIRGGSTLGNILLSHTSLLSVDVGLPQLAMHSAFETAGTYDIKYAIDVFKEFYSSNIVVNGNRYCVEKE